VALHEAFREDFARLEAAAAAVGAEDGDPRIAQPVADRRRDRRLRTEDDEIDAVLFRARDDRSRIGRADVGPILTATRGTGVPRRVEERLARG
jgi:hypothetical protein